MKLFYILFYMVNFRHRGRECERHHASDPGVSGALQAQQRQALVTSRGRARKLANHGRHSAGVQTLRSLMHKIAHSFLRLLTNAQSYTVAADGYILHTIAIAPSMRVLGTVLYFSV